MDLEPHLNATPLFRSPYDVYQLLGNRTVVHLAEDGFFELPIEECHLIQANHSQHLTNTSFVNIRCLEHAPTLSSSAMIRAIVLSAMALVSLLGNIATMLNIHRNRSNRRAVRHNCSAIYSLIFHLSISDVLVTGFCLIGEAVWSYTVAWLAGNVMCKLFKALQMFSLYLSTYVLVLVGIDRWVAVKYPMKSLNTAKRCNRFLMVSYSLSFLFSLPQCFIFRVAQGPFIEDFHQCVTHGFYTAHWQEQFYTTFTLFFMFIIPLTILIGSYLSTFRTISSSEKIFRIENSNMNSYYRRSDANRQKLIHKAKMKSLRISVVIVAAFIVCWTPYYIMMLIFMFLNPDKRLSEDLQSGIFFFGMSNSLINPLIYGAFHLWPIKKKRQYVPYRDGSIHRTASEKTNVTLCQNGSQRSFKLGMNNVPPKIPEEIALMSLEKELKTLDENVNQISANNQKNSNGKMFSFKKLLSKTDSHDRPSNL